MDAVVARWHLFCHPPLGWPTAPLSYSAYLAPSHEHVHAKHIGIWSVSPPGMVASLLFHARLPADSSDVIENRPWG